MGRSTMFSDVDLPQTWVNRTMGGKSNLSTIDRSTDYEKSLDLSKSNRSIVNVYIDLSFRPRSIGAYLRTHRRSIK